MGDTASLECSPGGNSFVPVTESEQEVHDGTHVDQYDNDYDEDDINAFRQTIMGEDNENRMGRVGIGRNGMIFEPPPQNTMTSYRTPATNSSSSITSNSTGVYTSSSHSQGNEIEQLTSKGKRYNNMYVLIMNH